MRQRYGAQGPAIDWTPSWNITPTRHIPVLLGGARGRRLGLMHWGWHPPAIGGRLLVNCRGEEAHGKALFRDVLPRRRCLVPASAFYEWQPATERGQRPQPYAFATVTGDMVLIGALWMPASSVGVVHGDACPGAVILMTIPANKTVAPVHDRMPLIIGDADMDRWLDPYTDLAVARQLIGTDADDHWRSWPVSRAVSDVKQDAPDLLDALRND